jgi:hypothetical protein
MEILRVSKTLGYGNSSIRSPCARFSFLAYDPKWGSPGTRMFDDTEALDAA